MHAREDAKEMRKRRNKPAPIACANTLQAVHAEDADVTMRGVTAQKAVDSLPSAGMAATDAAHCLTAAAGWLLLRARSCHIWAPRAVRAASTRLWGSSAVGTGGTGPPGSASSMPRSLWFCLRSTRRLTLCGSPTPVASPIATTLRAREDVPCRPNDTVSWLDNVVESFQRTTEVVARCPGISGVCSKEGL